MVHSTEELGTDGSDFKGEHSIFIWLRIMWRRKWLVVFGVTVALIGGLLYSAQRTPTYQTSAQVMVIRKAPTALASAITEPQSSYFEDYLSTHQVLLRSTVIVQRAVQAHHLDQLTSFATDGNPVGAIVGGLTSRREGTGEFPTNVIRLSYQGPVASECPIILQAVIDSYKRFLDETYRNMSDDTMSQVIHTTDALRAALEQKEKAYQEFRRNSPLIHWKGQESALPQEEWLGQIRIKRLEQMVRQAELQGRLEAIEAALKEGRSQAAILGMIKTARPPSPSPGAVPPERSWEDQLSAFLIQEQLLQADYGRNHPDLVSVRRRIAILREMLNRRGLDVGASSSGKSSEMSDDDLIQRQVESLRQELADIQRSLKTLGQMEDAEQKGFRELSRYKDEDKQYRDSIAQTQQLFEPIRRRLEEIKLIREQQGGFDARVIDPPGEGGLTGTSMRQILVVWGVFGLLGGIGLAYLADLRDESFRNPEEIRRRLGLPVVGHVPVLTAVEGEDRSVDPFLWAHLRPKSIEAEAFRGVRTALLFSTHGEVHKVIQVTSPNPADGKSIVAANLAVCMAQSGKQILLIDADFRKPRQHHIFGVTPGGGFAAVIAGDAEIQAVMRPSPVPGLTLMPCGFPPPNPAELLTSPRFKELLGKIRNDFDYVLIDTPPLLAVSDPSVVAARVDGVLLTIRIAKDGQQAAERAKEILQGLGAKILGVVVNGIGPGAGYGHYSSGQNYGYEEQGGYYHDAADTENGLQTKAAARALPHRKSAGLITRLFPWWK